MSNGEILSEAEVEFLLNAVADDEPATAPSPTAGAGDDVTMRGDLEQINLADIFQTLAMSKMEGVLRLRNPLADRDVLVRDGHVRILVPNRMATRRLGQRLLHAGLLTGEQLRAALQQQRTDKAPLGEVLVAQGAIAREALDDILAGQIAEDLFSLFTWRHGTFEFWKGPPAVPAQEQAFATCPEFEINSLLLEVARRSDEWQSILDAIGSLDEVPQVLADPERPFEPNELHQEILAGIDGRTSYRELAERTTHGLFEAARAARDLVRAGRAAALDEGAVVALAGQVANQGDKRRALVLLQTLRDRRGDRALGILAGMAQVLETAGERRLAGTMLLEAAQRQVDPATSLELARKARTLSPNDAGTLSFLRTILVAHERPDSKELEKVTLDLLDAMLAADHLPQAIEIVEDARRTGSLGPAHLAREARARQKSHDVQGAVKVLEELARLHDARGEKKAATDAWEAVFKLDRTRTDVRKLVAQRRRTRLDKWIRLGAAVSGLLMLGTTGLVLWQQQAFEAAVAAADATIGKQLEEGDRPAARATVEALAQALGDCEAVADQRGRVEFAEAAERTRLQKLMRAKANERLTAAAELLGKGELLAALAAYREVAAEAVLAKETSTVVGTRMRALLDDIASTGKSLPSRLPPLPGPLLDRRQLATNLADLQAAVSPSLQRAFAELQQLLQHDVLPEPLVPELREPIAITVAAAQQPFEQARRIAAAYQEALLRNDQQRELDPLFKAAVELENARDFAGALARYRELERQPAIDGELRATFRDRVARNATIVRLLDAMRAATAAGDFAEAQQQLRALRLSFPDVPFDTLAQLPLRVTSEPVGARVLCQGKDAGVTPLLLARTPADATRITVVLPGFRSAEVTVTGDDTGEFCGRLLLVPDHSWRHGRALEVAPVTTGDRLLLVDRAGNVCQANADGDVDWTFRSNDLSGLLSAPIVLPQRVLVASLDGELRCLDRATGKPKWTQPGLPTEAAPAFVADHVVLATTGRDLVAMTADGQERARRTLPAAGLGLVAHGSLVLVLDAEGNVAAFEAPLLQARWRQTTGSRDGPNLLLARGTLLVVDEHGHVVAFDASTGNRRWQQNLEVDVLQPAIVAGNDVLLPTRRSLLRFDVVTGAAGPVVPIASTEFHGGAQVVGNRLLLPLRDGVVLVLDDRGAPLYRLQVGKKPKVLVHGGRTFVTDEDHVVHVFDQLR